MKTKTILRTTSLAILLIAICVIPYALLYTSPIGKCDVEFSIMEIIYTSIAVILFSGGYGFCVGMFIGWLNEKLK